MTSNSDRVAGVKKRMLQVGVEEQRRDIGAVEHVLQIVGGRALPLQRLLQLAVQRGQFLVQRLQFLLRGQQLLVGRLEFLVDRQRLLVDRLLLLARHFQVVDRALQFAARGLQFALEFGDARRGGAGAGALAGRHGLRRIDEADQQQLLALAGHGLHLDAERQRLAVAVRSGRPARRCAPSACSARWIAAAAWSASPAAPWRADRALAARRPCADSGRSVRTGTGIRAAD